VSSRFPGFDRHLAIPRTVEELAEVVDLDSEGAIALEL
jgi:hypothetical protein